MSGANQPSPGTHDIFACRFASRLEARDAVIRAILDAVVSKGFRIDSHFHRLCLDEALVNAIVHGNAGDPCKQVSVRAFCSQEQWGVEVADQGRGFDWQRWRRHLEEGLDVTSVSGRGLALILASGADVEFLDGGRRLRMVWENAD